MRLKSLEIKGFKSFANETVIHFGEDVIGIVGPNGSGKSNVVDAIRWVLGEQKSSELRLDTMTSVIFNGAKNRKPGGLASVSLTFENTKNLLPTEYNTVTVTRMLYRTGESEYRLNGVQCRLKDITTLLLDTGIGSDSYAIIALGMVDDILADKDNSRRRMFEQAAGVSKYKARKRETLSKLESTSADLERIQDLLFEIEGNLNALEKQAKRTKRYFEIRDEYKHLSIDLGWIKVAALQQTQRDLQEQLEKEAHAYRQLEVQIRDIEAQIERERKTNLDTEKNLSERQRELNHLVGQIKTTEADKRMQEQKKQFVKQNRIKLVEDIQTAEVRIKQLHLEIERYRSEVEIEQHQEHHLVEALQAAESQLKAIRESHGALKSDLDVVVKDQQALERDVFELEKRKAVNNNQIQSALFELERSSFDTQQRREEVAQLQLKIDALEAEETAKHATLNALERAEEQRQQQLQQAEAAQEALTKEVSKINRELDARRNEFKLTQSMIENLEGFPESIRFLSSNKAWRNTPLLSDVIYVKEDYRVAIENYLEPYLNYYVVQTYAEAQRAIELLGKSQKGKANFFILEAFQDYVEPITLLPDTLSAVDLVETDPVYRNLCSFLLGNVLITERDELIPQISGNNLTLLAKSGRYIQRQFSVSGGSVGLFEGKRIGRKKSLEVLEHQIQQLEKESNRLATEFYNIKSKIETLKAQRVPAHMQEARNDLNKVTQQKITFYTRLENFETFLREADQKRAESGETIQRLRDANTTIEQELAAKQLQLVEAKMKISSNDKIFQQMAEQLSQASAVFNEKNIEYIRQQNKVSALQRERSYRERQLEELTQNLEANHKALKISELEAAQIADAILEMEQVLVEAYGERKEREAALGEVEQFYFKSRGEINELENKLRQLSKQVQNGQVLINNLKDKLTDVKFKMNAIQQRVQIEFNVDLSAVAEPSFTEPMTEVALEMKVERLKNRLDNYGEINPMAVEAYNEMKQRYDDISQQRDDVVQAKESLLQTIKEIEETATAQFLGAFERVRLNFIEVFRSLFTEDDNCDLILLDPENPLESKIEIVAKPKGKRPQTIAQLSGGEKTLTATALLFALYLLKPAPFCIFDEVDAPLDDTNISKFNKIIKKFSKDSQFIIVTHNKLTMAAVDTIYGVYMAEQGVSGVAPVDLRDFEHIGAFEMRT
ncbi:MAG TPA: chromosome segregation protein SMC [Saprospiraceae bacterium]|nr:chromosome segregation protein SMC [Saprospiraceae bacterium]HMP12487.1 chromosome segregation protein SMC [Saprospiraceae bacterium]